MSNISLLDCTLRDGGYVNDWRFGNKNLTSIFRRLTDSGVDFIEVGFLDDRRPFDRERSIMPDTASADKIFGNLDKKHSKLTGMIDYGTCAIENLAPASESCLDCIRVIFKKGKMYPAMEFCREVKKLGYIVFAQLVSITAYTDDELLELVRLVNDVKPFAVSMVDTYGLLYPETLLHYYEILDQNVDPSIHIGFHAHNNFQLAFANSLAFLEKERKHDILVDGTLFGMGKSAGNAPIELIAMRLNEKFGGHYKINPMLEAINESVMDFYRQNPWGYKTYFYLCSKNKCHPNYVKYFQQTEDLSVSKIDDLLARIEPEEKKLLYDKLSADELFAAYLSESDDQPSIDAFLRDVGGRELLLVGPGKNIVLQEGKVQKFIKERHPYVLSVNYVPENVRADGAFVTNTVRYHDMMADLMEHPEVKVLATTNIEPVDGEFAYTVHRAPLLQQDAKMKDNSFLMLLTLLMRAGVKKVTCAGFDGYSDKEDNYSRPAMEYSFVKREAKSLNEYMRNKILEDRETMEIDFLTYSAYDQEEDIHGAAI